MQTVKEQICKILKEEMQPKVIAVTNQSEKHKGHAGDDGSGESHFDIYIVADAFFGKNRIERHRMVYGILQKRLDILPHALSIKALAEENQE